jgi:hypothetical protein
MKDSLLNRYSQNMEMEIYNEVESNSDESERDDMDNCLNCCTKFCYCVPLDCMTCLLYPYHWFLKSF